MINERDYLAQFHVRVNYRLNYVIVQSHAHFLQITNNSILF